MASTDVIELGSSDDEAEPVPKKKKPTLNAMVRFPNEVPGLVIKPLKPVVPNLQKVIAGGAVTITNVKKGNVTTQVNKSRPNGRSVQKFVQKPPLKMPMTRNIPIQNPIAINNLSVNPFSLIKKPLSTRFQCPKLSLPPGITVKRTATSQNTLPKTSTPRKYQVFKKKPPGKIITTVELDDEEVPLTSGTSHQWYLRPEQQSHESVEKKEDITKDNQNNDLEKNINMELENNKEPDTKSYIEITIEDSPIKPLQTMKGFEVGTELPITIEDSPIKAIKSVIEQPCTSDSDPEKSNITEPQSKKRLDYPKDKEDSVMTEVRNVVEIDLEIVPSADESKEKVVENTNADMVDETRKDTDVQMVDMPRKVQTVLITEEVKDGGISKEPNTEQKNNSCEFHPIYQKFIDFCFELENSDDMAKIIEKKIKTYYRQCPKAYVESEEFTDMVSSKIFAMKAAPDKMYLYIKDIVDELNMQRKTARAVEGSNKENKKAVSEDDQYIMESAEYDSKRRRQIRKLDKTIKKLHRAIQKLEEQEVEFEDEEDSVYLLTERYKERLIRVHAKFCQLTNTKMPSEPRIQIEARPGLPTGPAKRLEKWVNKKVPIGTPLPFPDFHDVLRCVRDANDEDKLGWNEADIMEEARDLFMRCGKKLQRRRQENEWRIAAARISHDASTLDPAEKSDDLKMRLEENKTLAAKKEIEVLNKYADKQNQLKLVGEEIGDKEAEESPVESEDDDGNDESNSLGDKQKRKDRLKRLLHEKTTKISAEKENISNEAKVNEAEVEVLKGEEKMECEVILEESENKKEDIQEVLNEAQVISNDTSTNISGDGSKNEQKQEKTNDSDLYDVDSDIDELHLLQKLYSENEINSSTQESDSDTPIAISDTLDSDSDNESVKIQQNDDIISIENSSYSESEVTQEDCERTKASAVLKDTRIKNLQNSDVLVLSPSSGDKMDVDEENILLASSEEDNDIMPILHTDKTEANIHGNKLSNDDGANNECEIILDNCNENSLESDVKMYEVPLNSEPNDIIKINNKITSHNFESNILSNIQDHKINQIISQESNIQSENDIKVDNSRNILISIEKNQDNFKPITCKSNEVITNKVSCDEGSETIRNGRIDNKIDNCKENYTENNSLNDHSHCDEIELKIMAGKDPNPELNDKFEEYESCPGPNVIDNNDESASNSVSVVCTEKDLNECEIMDVNVEISGGDSSSTKKQIPCEDVEVAASVQCK